MKNLILLLLVNSFAFAQCGFRLNKTEYFATAIAVDLGASIKEKGLNIGAEIEYVRSIYIKASITNFAVLKDGYTDITGSAGISFTSGYFEKFRYYAGGRLGLIYRSAIYPTEGVEAGIDYMISKNTFIGIRNTYDYRSDQEFYDSPNEMRYSGFVKLGFKF